MSYSFKLSEKQKKKLRDAFEKKECCVAKIMNLEEGECPLPMTKAQMTKLVKCKEGGKAFTYKFSENVMKKMEKKEGKGIKETAKNIYSWIYKHAERIKPEVIAAIGKAKPIAGFVWKELKEPISNTAGLATGAYVTAQTGNPALGAISGTVVKKGIHKLGDKVFGQGAHARGLKIMRGGHSNVPKDYVQGMRAVTS